MISRHYEENPQDWGSRLELINDCINSDHKELAMLIIEHSLAVNPPSQIIPKLLEQSSICGFYSKLDSRKKFGKKSCEVLATNKANSWHTRNLARQNSTFYAESANELFPKSKIVQNDFIPNYDYAPMNPSITTHNGMLWMIQRSVNYRIRQDGSYDMRGDYAIRTVNYLLSLDDELNIITSEEILPPDNLPDPLYNLVIGWEDCRLFFWKNEPWCTATVRELNAEGACEIVLSRIITNKDGKKQFSDFSVIRPNFCPRQHEKNWMPMVTDNELYFVYSSDPVRIIDRHGNLISQKVTHFAADTFRGGGNVVPFDNGWLALIHESHIMPDNRRRYMHRFVWYDSLGNLTRFTEAFYFKELGIEFSAGLAKHPTRHEIIASFGIHDRTSWLAVFDINEIAEKLKPYSEKELTNILSADTMVWITSQTNCALKNRAIVDSCKEILSACELPLHQDYPKNWDNLIGIWHAYLNADPLDNIMDVAATHESAFLPSLAKLGYKNLCSINLTQEKTEVIDGISYYNGDCTATNFPDNHFSFISCLSVIEHGVDINKFLAESARILKPGGHLFISTDYWISPVNTMNQQAFGAPVRVFTADDIKVIAKLAAKYGLLTQTKVVLECEEKVVNWIGMDYTFINLLFVKK